MEKERATEVSDIMAGLVMEMTPAEWSRVKHSIEKQYREAHSKVRLTDREALSKAIESDLRW